MLISRERRILRKIAVGLTRHAVLVIERIRDRVIEGGGRERAGKRDDDSKKVDTEEGRGG
jgi:hypothetical protein